jgi:hypothetical protein
MVDSHLAPQRPGYSGSDMLQLDELIAAKIKTPRGQLPKPESAAETLRRLSQKRY